ncbi:MAG: hypothetical protein J2P58_06135 [Acidimicrobiaceae bacterium]|nr:hypothetical protein [Acidimicrobiaceae bacterium]
MSSDPTRRIGHQFAIADPPQAGVRALYWPGCSGTAQDMGTGSSDLTVFLGSV